MGRLLKDVRFKKRGKYWSYKLKGQNSFRSTGETSKARAEQQVNRLIQENGFHATTESMFTEYADKFFRWETCPRIARRLDEGKPLTKRYVEIQRLNLVTHILPSNLRLFKMTDIRRNHILDFRTTLRKKGLAPGTINKIMGVLKVIFNEASYRQDILYNPVQGIGNVKDTSKGIDMFTDDELRTLFRDDFTSIWGDRMSYACFFIASNTGMRRGEVLALKWKHIHFDLGYISVKEAWKTVDTIGPPKSGKPRTVMMSEALKRSLLKYWEEALLKSKDSLLFCYPDGTRLGETWWLKRFSSAVKKAEISVEGRRLRPHSFRHGVNTILRNAGENPDRIRASLGWNSEAVQDRYTHWQPEHLKNQGSIIDEIWSKTGSS